MDLVQIINHIFQKGKNDSVKNRISMDFGSSNTFQHFFNDEFHDKHFFGQKIKFLKVQFIKDLSVTKFTVFYKIFFALK